MTGGARWWRTCGAALWLFWRASPAVALATVLLTVVSAAAPAGSAWMGKLLFDELTRPQHGTGRVTGLAVANAAGAAVLVLLALVSGHLAKVAGARLSVLVEGSLFQSVNRLGGLRYFENPAFLNRLRLAEQAAQEAPSSISGFVLDTGRAVVGTASFVSILLVIWAPIAGLLALAAATALVAHIGLAKQRARVTDVLSEVHRRRLAYRSLLADQRAAKEVRLFGLGALFHGRMLVLLRRTTQDELAVERTSTLAQGGLSLLASAVAGIGTVVGAVRVAQAQLTIGDLTLFLAAVASIQQGIGSVVSQYGYVASAVRLFRHFLAVQELPSDVPSGSRRPGQLRRGIEFRNVWFRYDESGPWVLRGVDLTIPYGGAIGLVGLNGAGKSTVVKLLCRLYDPQRGQIRWDGTDLREYDLEALRRRIGATFQDYMNYDLTAAENVGLGDVDRLADREHVTAAARLAEIDRTLARLPNGYDTLLSRIFAEDGDEQPGTALSGGQWQRIALARSFMRDAADLLILDEPSSGLDAEAEYEIHQALRRHRDGRTSLLISHRLSALRDADKIAVLRDGRITEQGSHTELLARGGAYARLFILQARGYRDEAEVPA